MSVSPRLSLLTRKFSSTYTLSNQPFPNGGSGSRVSRAVSPAPVKANVQRCGPPATRRLASTRNSPRSNSIVFVSVPAAASIVWNDSPAAPANGSPRCSRNSVSRSDVHSRRHLAERRDGSHAAAAASGPAAAMSASTAASMAARFFVFIRSS